VVALLALPWCAMGLPALRLEKSGCAVDFQATSAPAAVRISGSLRPGNSCSGALVLMGGQLTGSVFVALDALDTGIALRSRHLKEKYLETAKFPTAELTLGAVAVPEGSSDFDFPKLPFQATLKLHGAERPIEGTASVRRQSGKLKFALRFDLRLSEFSIPSPDFLGVKAADGVLVKAEAQGPLEEIVL
jgi:hypothetical protein